MLNDSADPYCELEKLQLQTQASVHISTNAAEADRLVGMGVGNDLLKEGRLKWGRAVVAEGLKSKTAWKTEASRRLGLEAKGKADVYSVSSGCAKFEVNDLPLGCVIKVLKTRDN